MVISLTSNEINANISKIKLKYGGHLFESGNCHDLSLALQFCYGGDLVIGIRTEKDLDDVFFSETYSHMVWSPCRIKESVLTETYDIHGGPNALTTWESMWSDHPDEKGLVSTFEWKKIDTFTFFMLTEKYKTTINLELIDELKTIILKGN